MYMLYVCVYKTLCTGPFFLVEFLIRDEASEVKTIVEKAGEPEEKLKEVYARFQGLVRVYKP